MLMAEALGLFGGVGEDALALVGEGEVHGSRDLFADGGVLLDLFANGFYGGVGTEEAIGERLVLAQEPEQEMFGFDVGRTELTRLVAREKDDAARLLCIAFEHDPPFDSSPSPVFGEGVVVRWKTETRRGCLRRKGPECRLWQPESCKQCIRAPRRCGSANQLGVTRDWTLLWENGRKRTFLRRSCNFCAGSGEQTS